MYLVCENSTLSVNNQCDVAVYGLSGSRSPHGVSPVEESTVTPHVLGLWEFHSLCKQSMWCGCLWIEWIKVSTRCQSCRRIYNYSTYDNVAYKLQNIYWQVNKSMWCFCDLQYRDSLIPIALVHTSQTFREILTFLLTLRGVMTVIVFFTKNSKRLITVRYPPRCWLWHYTLTERAHSLMIIII